MAQDWKLNAEGYPKKTTAPDEGQMSSFDIRKYTKTYLWFSSYFVNWHGPPLCWTKLLKIRRSQTNTIDLYISFPKTALYLRFIEKICKKNLFLTKKQIKCVNEAVIIIIIIISIIISISIIIVTKYLI